MYTCLPLSTSVWIFYFKYIRYYSIYVSFQSCSARIGLRVIITILSQARRKNTSIKRKRKNRLDIFRVHRERARDMKILFIR